MIAQSYQANNIRVNKSQKSEGATLVLNAGNQSSNYWPLKSLLQGMSND